MKKNRNIIGGITIDQFIDSQNESYIEEAAPKEMHDKDEGWEKVTFSSGIDRSTLGDESRAYSIYTGTEGADIFEEVLKEQNEG
jgi:hypothetical protein